MLKPRIALVDFLNAWPLGWGFLDGIFGDAYTILTTTPAGCAEALARGEAEAGLVPSIEYARIPGLAIVPGLGVVARGAVRSVLLFSRVPVAEIRSIAVDDASRTSVALLRLLLAERWHVTPVLTPARADLAAMLADHDAALLIGDAALTAPHNGYFVYDLAAEWRALTGLPFVFALWAVAANAGNAAGAAIPAEHFQRSLAHGNACREAIAARAGAELGLSREAVSDYLDNALSYQLDDDAAAGLAEFYRRAAAAGLIERAPEMAYHGEHAHLDVQR